MRILFLMTDLQLVKYYYQTLRFLLNRGHRIHLAFFNPREPEKDKILHESLLAEFPDTFSCGAAPRKRGDVWNSLCVACSWALDYLLYFDPALRDAHRLRERVEVRVHPAFVRILTTYPYLSTPAGRAFVRRLLRAIYDAIPVSSAMRKFITHFTPDLLLVTPLVFQGSLQAEYLRAARILGLPNACCIASWDNLTTKGVVRGNPDKIIVWNDIQKREAVTLHGVSPDKIIVTGAQYFDDWFVQNPARTRESFCKLVGISPDRPILLYLCSTNFMAPNETQFVLRWLSALRTSGIPEIAEAGILIRPHPKYVEQWKSVDLSHHTNVVVWPPHGEYTSTDFGKANFYDSVYHSLAVVGMNTTAMIESAIIGKCVMTILAPELNESQTNTIHFGYMRHENGGFLYLASDLQQHLRQLQDILARGHSVEDQVRRFVQEFVRPHGIDHPCVPILSHTIEELFGLSTPRISFSLSKIALTSLLYPVAVSLAILRLFASGKRKQEKMRRKNLLHAVRERGDDPLQYAWKKRK